MDIGNVQNYKMLDAQRKIYKIRKNPYNELTYNEFRKKYRFSKAECLQIVNEIRDFLPRAVNNCGKPISPSLQLLIALRYLTIRLTVSRCLSQVCRALASLKNNYIKFTLTNEELATKKEDFRKKFNMPSIIGAIDCTHIRIKKVICDANCHILHVIARWRGSAHDSRIWNKSLIKEQFENGSINGILLSDSGYACTPYMLTPILNPQNNSKKYNREIIWKNQATFSLSIASISLENTKVALVALSVLHNMKLHFKKHLNINNINPKDNNNSSTEDSNEDDDYNEESESDSSAGEDNYNVVQINQNRGNVARAPYIRQFFN
ncbi:hypothetical protein QTP88_000682 [Uroleucon formosanum]